MRVNIVNKRETIMNVWAIITFIPFMVCIVLVVFNIISASLFSWLIIPVGISAFIHIIVYFREYKAMWLSKLDPLVLYRKLSKEQNRKDKLLVQSSALLRRDLEDPKNIERRVKLMVDETMHETLNRLRTGED